MIALGSTQFKAAYLGSTKLKNIALGGSLLLNKIFQISNSNIIDFSSSYAYNSETSDTHVAIESIDGGYYSVPPDCTHLSLISKQLDWSFNSNGTNKIATSTAPLIYNSSIKTLESGSTISVCLSYPKTNIYSFTPTYGTNITFKYPYKGKDNSKINNEYLYAFNKGTSSCVYSFSDVGIYGIGSDFGETTTYADYTEDGSYYYATRNFDIESTMNQLSGFSIPIGWKQITGGSYVNWNNDTYDTTIKYKTPTMWESDNTISWDCIGEYISITATKRK